MAQAQTADFEAQARRFAALGDRTRLALLAKLVAGPPQSISQLKAESPLSRQALSKHLQVLEAEGFVSAQRVGREKHYQIDLQPFADLNDYLNFVSSQWSQNLQRLKSFVEAD